MKCYIRIPGCKVQVEKVLQKQQNQASLEGGEEEEFDRESQDMNDLNPMNMYIYIDLSWPPSP